jgi:enoyl-CoA hydratase/carnithine racemase
MDEGFVTMFGRRVENPRRTGQHSGPPAIGQTESRMSYQEILYNVDDGILTITMNRPEKLNAFTGTMMAEMIDAFDRSDADDSIRAVIVTGAGRAFCAGADLSAGGATFNSEARAAEARADRPKGLNRDGGGLLTLRIFDSKKPVIAAVNGPAVGIGVTMTLAMDIRLAADVARFGFVFARRGIVPEACSSWFLPRVVGISQALEWTYSGRVFTADEALAGRLVRSIHPKDDLLPTARVIAREIAANTSAISVTLIRHMMWKMLGADHPMEAHKLDSRGVYYTGRSPDAKEGVEAFLEKRPARFPGKVSENMPEFFPWWTEPNFE